MYIVGYSDTPGHRYSQQPDLAVGTLMPHPFHQPPWEQQERGTQAGLTSHWHSTFKTPLLGSVFRMQIF